MTSSLRPAFHSDNVAGASPQVLAAITEAAAGSAVPYGGDELSSRVADRLADIFDCDLSVALVATGTAANCLALSSLTPPWGAVLCHADSHIHNDENTAPEFFTGGARLISVAGAESKLDPQMLSAALARRQGDVHSPQPATVSITQITEVGSLYSLAEIQGIGEICRQAGVPLHMDGARFANALVALDCSPAAMTWQAGVTALSFGASKNGVLAAEAVVLFDTSKSDELAYRRKRSGHLFSKMRLLSAQLDAYLQDDLWLHNARHANAMAAQLATGLAAVPGVQILGKAEANMLFCQLPQPMIARLLAEGYGFYTGRWAPGVVRLVTSFATTAAEVDAFIAGAAACAEPRQKGDNMNLIHCASATRQW